MRLFINANKKKYWTIFILLQDFYSKLMRVKILLQRLICMSNWSYLKVLQQESANNVNYINLEVFKNTNVDTNAIKNVLRLFSSTVFKDLMK